MREGSKQSLRRDSNAVGRVLYTLRMNIKIAFGLLAAIVVVGIGVLLASSNSPAQVVPEVVTQPTATATTTTPAEEPQTVLPKPAAKAPELTVKAGAPTMILMGFDKKSLTSTSTYPAITGTANVPTIAIAVYDSTDKGLVGAARVPVTRGTWSYYVSVPLAPGMYTIKIYSGAVMSSATLTVVSP